MDGDGEGVERDLLVAVEAGDHTALGGFYDRCGANVYGMALKMLRDPQQAEEVTQAVFLSVWHGLESFDQARGSVVAWLVRCARDRAAELLIASASTSRAAISDGGLRTELGAS